MAGHNHYPWCTCGWCIGGQSTGRPKSYSFSFPKRYTPSYKWDYDDIPRISSYESFVNPNARCPVCGKKVFFYQSPYGGKVFFDSLGPPWPKHPCTTKDKAPVPIIEKPPYKQPSWTSWENYAWKPYICKSCEREKNYKIIKLVRGIVEITGYFTDTSISLKEGSLVYLRKINLIEMNNEMFEEMFEASILLDNNESKNILLTSTNEVIKPFETAIMEPYKLKTYGCSTISRISNYLIDKSYYEILVKDPSTSIIILTYIFFRFFDDKRIKNTIIEHPMSKKTGMNDIFSYIVKLGIKGFMDNFYKKYKFYDNEHIEIFKKIENAPLANGIKKIIEQKENKLKPANIKSSFSQKGWTIK